MFEELAIVASGRTVFLEEVIVVCVEVDVFLPAPKHNCGRCDLFGGTGIRLEPGGFLDAGDTVIEIDVSDLHEGMIPKEDSGLIREVFV